MPSTKSALRFQFMGQYAIFVNCVKVRSFPDMSDGVTPFTNVAVVFLSIGTLISDGIIEARAELSVSTLSTDRWILTNGIIWDWLLGLGRGSSDDPLLQKTTL